MWEAVWMKQETMLSMRDSRLALQVAGREVPRMR